MKTFRVILYYVFYVVCGSYDSGCVNALLMGTAIHYQVDGPLNADPTDLYLSVQTFMDVECNSTTEFLSLNTSYTLAAQNDIEKTFTATATNAFFKATELFIQGMNCTPALVIGQYYSVLDVNCTDESGEDPFADARASIGNSSSLYFSRNSTGLTISDGSEPLYLPYLNSVGCSGTTVTPTTSPTTIPPTTSPTPTTVPPTTPPTPTTIPPTIPPTPTTVPPTTPPTPTTIPPTIPPTSQPTAQPTEKPTKAPMNMMLILIITGVVVLLVIVLILIICCCKKSGSNTNSRVRRVGYKSVESAPLKKNYI